MIRKRLALLVLALLVLILLPRPTQEPSLDKQSEIVKIKTTNNLDEQVRLYTQLIKRVGPEKAQEELYHLGLPFDGQTHLLNHTIGDYLYDTYKTKGLTYCKDYFLSSCYHGFVIKAVADGGFNTLKEVMHNCFKKGSYVAVQCTHAIGHGFLAWEDYPHLPKALTDCDKLAKQIKDFPLYNCHDGVFMENIWAVHEGGKPSENRWIKDTDPTYPCNATEIEERYRNACWSNQPMRMYQMFGGDLGRIGQECLNLTNPSYQKTCFDGLARQIHPLTKASVSETFRLCSFMPGPWNYSCVVSIVRAAFGVGDRKIPFELCDAIDQTQKTTCYRSLGEIISAYYPQKEEKITFCNKIKAPYFRKICQDSS